MELSKNDIDLLTRYKEKAWQPAGISDIYSSKVELPGLSMREEIQWVTHNAQGLILDAGSGTGRFSSELLKQGKKTVSIDISREMLKTSRRFLAPDKMRLVQGNIFRLPFAENTFDTVISIWVVMHFPEWQDILREYTRVLKPGGRLMFEMSNKEMPAFFQKNRLRFDALERFKEAVNFEMFTFREEVIGFLETLGIRTDETFLYEYIIFNLIFEFFAGQSYKDIEESLKELEKGEKVYDFWKWMRENIVPFLPARFARKCFYVCTKTCAIPADSSLILNRIRLAKTLPFDLPRGKRAEFLEMLKSPEVNVFAKAVHLCFKACSIFVFRGSPWENKEDYLKKEWP